MAPESKIPLMAAMQTAGPRKAMLKAIFLVVVTENLPEEIQEFAIAPAKTVIATVDAYGKMARKDDFAKSKPSPSEKKVGRNAKML